MSGEDDVLRIVRALGAGSALENYIIPGVRSTLLAKSLDGGVVRVFDMSRDQEYDITPHDHRYDFECFVISGSVTNRRYWSASARKDDATHARLQYDYQAKALNEASANWFRAGYREEVFGIGEWYSMKSYEFHSIRFAKGSKILFIESPEIKKESYCLLPYHYGRICNTFIWRDWMMEFAP